MDPAGKPLPPVPASFGTPLFAVLIGINKYEMGSDRGPVNLKGAVADAIAFKRYLENSLDVPSDHIVLLTDEGATRSAIISAIESLGKNDLIHPGNPILIYYAGHGTEIDAPENWECGNPERKIQAIIPYDCDSPTESGEYIAPIPDRTINGLLFTIADTHKKGNNITVIFDCCHSASATRAGEGSNNADLVPRLAKLTPRVYSNDLDRDIWDMGSEFRGTYISSKFTNHGMGSHMLLAASGAAEQAWENRFKTPEGRTMIRGCFSIALLNLLDKESPHKLRYRDILHRIQLDSGQNPQCEGHHKDRTLFSFSAPPALLHQAFPLRYENKTEEHEGRLIVEAGLIHNVTQSSEFTIYYEDDVNRVAPIGVIGVKTLRQFSLIAKVPNISCPYDPARITPRLVAIQTMFDGQDYLRIWIDPSNGFLPIFNQLKADYSENLRFISLATQQRQSDIEVQLTDPEKMELLMKIFTPPSVMPSPDVSYDWTVNNIKYDSGSWDGLVNILLQAAKFYGELTRTPNNPRVSQNIGVEFYELERDVEALGTTTIGGPEVILIPKMGAENLYKNGAVDIGISECRSSDIPYGIKLTNNSSVDFYVNIFCFANDKLSIAPCVQSGYRADSPFTFDIPLPKKKEVVRKLEGGSEVKELVLGSLAIGYGAAGYNPLSFRLTGNPHKTEVDFLKIYLTTEPVNLSYLKQLSPFGPTTRACKPWKPPPFTTWSHIIIPVIEKPCD